LRWLVILLLMANLAIAGYALLVDPGARKAPDVRALELKAEQVKIVGVSGSGGQTACLEWSKLSADELARLQDRLSQANIDRLRVLGQTLVIVEPTPAQVARISEIRASLAAGELRAIACPLTP
jgi:hypothetical protein